MAIVSSVLILSSLQMLGCTHQSSSSSGATEGNTTSHLPAHFPSNLRLAIERLLDFADASLANHSDHETHHESDGPQQTTPELMQIADIIGWLPILSADSDVDETTFNQLDGLATEFSRLRDERLKQVAETGEAGWIRNFLLQHQEILQEALLAYRSKTVEPDDEISDGAKRE